MANKKAEWWNVDFLQAISDMVDGKVFDGPPKDEGENVQTPSSQTPTKTPKGNKTQADNNQVKVNTNGNANTESSGNSGSDGNGGGNGNGNGGFRLDIRHLFEPAKPKPTKRSKPTADDSEAAGTATGDEE